MSDTHRTQEQLVMLEGDADGGDDSSESVVEIDPDEADLGMIEKRNSLTLHFLWCHFFRQRRHLYA